MKIRTKAKQKFLSLFMMLALGLTFFVAPAPANAAIDMITLDNSDHFTILENANIDVPNIKVRGLDGTTWAKEDILDPGNIEWISTNLNVVGLIDINDDAVATLSGTDTVAIRTIGAGQAYVTAQYKGKTVNSVVVVESGSTTSSVSNISIQVDFPSATDISLSSQTVPLTDLTVYPVGLTDVSKVLKKDASALHALTYALIQTYGNTWVNTTGNLNISSGGSYVSKIGSDANSWTQGWQYKVIRNSVTIVPDYAASVFKLEPGDTVIWEYKAF